MTRVAAWAVVVALGAAAAAPAQSREVARRVVVTAIASDPRQASLHALLGDLYARTGLPHEAEEAYGGRARSRPPIARTEAASDPVGQGRTPRRRAAARRATLETDSVMRSSSAMATASRNVITRRSKNSSSSEARGSATSSSPMKQ